jgi:hypothetical protein
MPLLTIRLSICVISIVRTITLVKVSYLDITYSVTLALIWSMLEPTLGITIACVPVIRPLIKGMASASKGSGYIGSGSNFDARNFQNVDEQQLYPLKDVRHETVIRGVSKDGESLRTGSNLSTDAVNFHATQEVDHIEGINIRREFEMRVDE